MPARYRRCQLKERLMATYVQLQAEQWWGREIVTPEMDWLGDELCRRTGRPRDAAGSKGDNHHLRGAHRSQEWILHSAYCTSRTYTVQSGLTAAQARHIGGFDFTPGTVEAMVAQCKRIYAAMRAGQLDEVREFFGNVDGDQVVDGWDNVRDRAASSDSSHLWHWHLTIDRRRCADRALMERIVAIALGDEDDMSAEAEEKIDSTWNAMFFGGGSMGRKVPTPVNKGSLGNALVDKIDYLLTAVDRDTADRAAIEAREVARDTAQTELLRQVLAAAGNPWTPEQFGQALDAMRSAAAQAGASATARLEAKLDEQRAAIAAAAKAEADALAPKAG
jgi:hypothetical protein